MYDMDIATWKIESFEKDYGGFLKKMPDRLGRIS